jgi:putative Ca2+/H+ antiporter (TMEM165/GDT1 family)
VLEAFLVTFPLVFVAELGDKSQFVVLALASRSRAAEVRAGLTISSATLAGASVAIGATLAVAFPARLVALAAGALFLVFAVLAIRDARAEESTDDGDAVSPGAQRSAVIAVAAAFFVAELGDKTMIATFALASRQDAIGTCLGATGGEVAVGVIAIAVGRALGTRIPAKLLRYLSAAAFGAFGILFIAEGLRLV